MPSHLFEITCSVALSFLKTILVSDTSGLPDTKDEEIINKLSVKNHLHFVP